MVDLKISVLMSVYNGEKYLKDVIPSILNQTLQDFEFIIIDDGSNDNSLKIIKKYAEKDERIKVIHNQNNLGLTKSLNKGIKLSRGRFIARQDVDDISLHQRLEKQFKFLLAHPKIAFCGTNVIIKQAKNRGVEFFNYNDIKRNLIVKNCFSHSTIFIRKKVLQKYGMYDEKYLFNQDYELWCRYIYKFRLKAENLPEPLLILNMPIERLANKGKKFILQKRNYIITKLYYFKYTQQPLSNLKSVISILINTFDLFYVLFINLIRFKFSQLK